MIVRWSERQHRIDHTVGRSPFEESTSETASSDTIALARKNLETATATGYLNRSKVREQRSLTMVAMAVKRVSVVAEA
ncbi:hypothetical protein G6F62_015557 [Rhizopus arrhizus]|nr:hypothetical protein G6F62_015557 [Rhizopus arrhizus]